MALTISLLRHPAGAAPETRWIAPVDAFGIGRGSDNDWVLADPDRHLSKRHCVLSWQGDFWQIADLSTNGTFLNGETAPIGPGQVRDLRDGDRLRLGGYEMELRIVEERRVSFTPKPAAFGLDDSLLIAPQLAFAGPAVSGPAFGGPALSGPAFGGPVQPDHCAAVEDAFAPPRPIALIGDDWDLDIPGVPVPAEPVAQPALKPVLAPPPAEPSADLFAAFLRGAGVSTPPAGDPVAAMEGLGAAFRALVGGLRETLIARAAIKSEFRIEQTIIRARGNNPLKFAATDDDALAALLGTGQSPAAAITESLRDIRLHEIATMAAMQSAVHSLMRELAPGKLETGAGGLLPAQRKARAFEAYEALHARITQALADDFDSVFGRAFARAYEQTVREASCPDK